MISTTLLWGPAHESESPPLVVGPSLGTSVAQLWGPVLPYLRPGQQVWGWDLPGHGVSTPATGFSLEQLAIALLDQLPAAFDYAGVSVGGAVGLHLALADPTRVRCVAAICTGAVIGTPSGWEERAAQVEDFGTSSVVQQSAARWFADGFAGGASLLQALPDVDDRSYAAVCRALAGHDVRDRLGSIEAPLVAVAGTRDLATPVELLEELAQRVMQGDLVVLDGVAHLPTIEAPEAVARAIIRMSQRARLVP